MKLAQISDSNCREDGKFCWIKKLKIERSELNLAMLDIIHVHFIASTDQVLLQLR